MALPMLVGVGLMTHSLWNLTGVDLGVRTDHMLGFYLDSPAAPSNRKQINSYYRNMLARIEAVPGVTSVAALSHLPLDSLHEATRFSIAGSLEYGRLSSGPRCGYSDRNAGLLPDLWNSDHTRPRVQ